MRHNRLSSILLVPLLAFTACDALGPNPGNTRVALSSFAAGGPSFSVSSTALDGATPSNSSSSGTTLALVQDLAVTVTAVQALPAQYLDHRDLDGRWETLTLPAPATVNLLSLPSDPGAAVTLVEGDLPPGAYVRLRLLVSEIKLTLLAPLTLGKHTFPAGEPIDVSLVDPWVSIPGAFFTVADDDLATVDLYFDAGATIGKLIVTSDGRLRFAPVFHGKS